MPTAANLNLYRGRDSCVRWHCDDEPLFRERGEAKLIVSVSSGTQALFKWEGKSSSDGEVSSCCLGRGDILVMDGQCQDEFLHCTDPGLEQERINVTFRWITRHTASCALRTGVVCCLPTCAQGSSAAVKGGVGGGPFWALWVLLGVLCMWVGGGGGVSALLFSLAPKHSANGRASLVRTVKLARAGLNMVDSWSWMANVTTSSSQYDRGLEQGQEWRIVCQRVRRVHPLLWRSLGRMVVFCWVQPDVGVPSRWRFRGSLTIGCSSWLRLMLFCWMSPCG